MTTTIDAGPPRADREESLPAFGVIRESNAPARPVTSSNCHLYQCDHCGKEHFVPHSCRNRHCPTCQGVNSVKWLAKQAEVLPPIPYFHLVFTLPHDLNSLIRQNQAALYDLLFATASATLLEFGRNNLNVQIGVTAVLHTWS